MNSKAVLAVFLLAVLVGGDIAMSAEIAREGDVVEAGQFGDVIEAGQLDGGRKLLNLKKYFPIVQKKVVVVKPPSPPPPKVVVKKVVPVYYGKKG